jgi:DNA-binding MarR family transcriptional regulator
MSTAAAGEGRRGGRRRLAGTIRTRLRAMSSQLGLLSQAVGGRLDLRAVDLECLDLIDRYAPLTPTALARHAGVHPATLTGILNRLESAGWITRDRDPVDRRAVVLTPVRERNAEILRLYGPMNRSLDQILARYTPEQLELLADFLDRATRAATDAADTVGGKDQPPRPR